MAEKEKSLIDLAREHMEKVGADPEQGVDVPETPASAQRETANKPIRKNVEEDDITDVVTGSLESAVEELLSNVKEKGGWQTIELPSKGLAYVQSDGYVQVRALTFSEEKRLRSIKSPTQGAKIIKSLFTDCVMGLEYDGMTILDKNYLLFKIREASYGNDYPVVAVCEHCNAKNSLNVEIDQIPVNYAPDDYKEPLSLVLPDSEQPVKFVSPRCKDEQYLTDIEIMTDNLWRFAISVGKYKEEKVRKAFFEKTTVRDVATFREALASESYGLETDMSFECADCAQVSKAVIPFNESFFSVS